VNTTAYPVWKCPKCLSTSGKHGKGLCKTPDPSDRLMSGECDGLVCWCGNPSGTQGGPAHGTVENPCTEAECGHCGWKGLFPPDALLVGR
jgi:hypothetical protein